MTWVSDSRWREGGDNATLVEHAVDQDAPASLREAVNARHLGHQLGRGEDPASRDLQ
jgi:hypothetical protein